MGTKTTTNTTTATKETKETAVVPPPTTANRWRKVVDIRAVIGLFLLTLAAILLVILPTQAGLFNLNRDRVIRVTGEASVVGVPDQFVFMPSYTVQNEDHNAALAAIASKSAVVTTGLKALGVTENQIKSSANSGYSGYGGYGKPEPAIAPAYPSQPGDSTSKQTYSLQLIITVENKDLAQKIQNYLNETNPSGIVTPSSQFSDARRKQLEAKARDDATKDARAKAAQSASNLGFRLGAVKSVSDGSGVGGGPIVRPLLAVDDAASSSASRELSVQPGSQSLPYSVTVEYYVR